MDYNTCTIGLNGVRTACASADQPAAWIVYAQYTPESLAGISPRFAKLTDMRPPNADVSIYKFELTGQAFNLTNTPWFGSGAGKLSWQVLRQGGASPPGQAPVPTTKEEG